MRDILNIWFNNIDGVGLRTRVNLLKKLGNVDRIYDASRRLLEKYIPPEQAELIVNSKSLEKSKEIIHKLRERNIKIIYPGHKDFPEKLYNIHDMPTLLYYKGIIKPSLSLYNCNISMVGSRKTTVYGKEVAYKFAQGLAREGINIISGLARGIDSISHRGALSVGGYTVGVLGCGINVTYPMENAELFSEMEQTGLIISEYGLDSPPIPGCFPMRNRIISGLSDGVFVVEAKKKSGSLITADYALEQGKQIFALPGKIHDKNSEGTNHLIKSGAFCVTGYEDILIDLKGGTFDMKYMEKNDFSSGMLENPEKNLLAPVEKMVYSCLSLEPTYIDDIIQNTGIGVTKTISTLFTMEEKGLIKQPLKGYYIISI